MNFQNYLLSVIFSFKNNYLNPEKKDVGEKQKKEAVLEVFHNVADSYDLMNDAMSLGKMMVGFHFLNIVLLVYFYVAKSYLVVLVLESIFKNINYIQIDLKF